MNATAWKPSRIAVWTLLCLALAGGPGIASAASDTAKEKRWADQIVDGLITGDAQWLDAGGRQFLAIYAEQTTEEPKGAVILVHGVGVHPDWPDIIHPLRTELPDHGWSTLSIQMPVLANEAQFEDYAPLFDEVAPRFDAALAYLRTQGVSNVAIVAHSLGAIMAAHYLAGRPAGIAGFVAIGMGASDADPRMDTRVSLGTIGVPVLDMYGSRDLESVLNTADERAAATRRAGNADYRQTAIDGADHFFAGSSDVLVKTVWSWLEKFAPGKEIEKR